MQKWMVVIKHDFDVLADRLPGLHTENSVLLGVMSTEDFTKWARKEISRFSPEAALTDLTTVTELAQMLTQTGICQVLVTHPN